MRAALIALMLWLPLASFAQQDSLALLSLTFKHPFEEKVFKNLQSASTLDLLLAISETMDEQKAMGIKARIDAFAATIAQKGFYDKTEEKRIKMLFQHTHEHFFAKYEEVSNFDRIFNAKIYNCVSATALYGLLLEGYKVPFHVKELPTHVYAIAYPNTKNIVIESTNPLGGYYVASDQAMQAAVDHLVKAKALTQQEVNAKGVTKAYNEYFYGEENVELKVLAGMQYYNESITFVEQKKYDDAFNSIQKSVLIYPSEKAKYLKHALLGDILAKAKYNNMRDIALVTEWANFYKEEPILKEAIVDIFRVQLFERNNEALADSSFRYMQKHLQDSTLKAEISYFLDVLYTEFYAKKNDFETSLVHAEKAWEINKENVNMQSVISYSVLNKLGESTPTPSLLKQYKMYEEKYTFLKENLRYQSFGMYLYTALGGKAFIADDFDKGMQCLQAYEEIYTKYGSRLKLREGRSGHIYAELCAYYYRKKDYQKSKEAIEKGLAVEPENEDMRGMLEMVEVELKKKR